MIIREFINRIEKIVPQNIALSFDNVGLLIGNEEDNISGIYISLDINDEIIEYVHKNKINTIVTHHPLIFNSFKRLVDSNMVSKKIRKCISYGINVIAYHTNLDAIINGMNDELVKNLKFMYKNIEILESNKINSDYGIGRILDVIEPINIDYIIGHIKKLFNLDTIKIIDSGKIEMNRICIINGSGNSLVSSCFGKKVDLIITGDITYHTAFEAKENNITIIDIGHFHSENMVYKRVMKKIIDNIIENDIDVYCDDLLTDVYRYI